jgi:hypothetical protein
MFMLVRVGSKLFGKHTFSLGKEYYHALYLSKNLSEKMEKRGW